MHSFSLLLEALTTIGYGLTAAAYIMAYVKDTPPYTTARGTLLLATICIQVLFVGSVSADLHHCLVTNGLEVIELLAFVIAFIYVVLERVTKSQASGVLIIPVVFVLQLVSSLFRTVDTNPNPLFRSVAMNVHVTTALFGYGALAMAAAYGGMYLLLYRTIKRSTFGKAFERFPSLGHLEQMSIISVRFGLAFLTISILVGLIRLPSEVPNFSYADPKLLMTLLLWLVYTLGLVAQRYLRWEGRRLMALALYGFIGALVSLTVVNVVFGGLHRFM